MPRDLLYLEETFAFYNSGYAINMLGSTGQKGNVPSSRATGCASCNGRTLGARYQDISKRLECVHSRRG